MKKQHKHVSTPGFSLQYTIRWYVHGIFNFRPMISGVFEAAIEVLASRPNTFWLSSLLVLCTICTYAYGTMTYLANLFRNIWKGFQRLPAAQGSHFYPFFQPFQEIVVRLQKIILFKVIVRRETRGSTRISLELSWHRISPLFLGRFKGSWLLKLQKIWFQRLRSKKGASVLRRWTLPKIIQYSLK